MVGLKRVKTGIKGFDELINGGIPAGFNVLITGSPGTGKTIFGLQYLYNGALAGDPGVFVSLESSAESLKSQASEFGWDLSKLEKSNKLIILKVPTNKSDYNIFEVIEKSIKKINAKRLVFDSLISFSINFDQFKIPLDYDVSQEVKQLLGEQATVFYKGNSKERITYLLLNKLLEFGTTNIIITASDENKIVMTADGVSEYASDGLIFLHSVEGDEDFNTLNVVKLRLSKINRGIYNFTFSPDGIKIKK